MLFKNEGMKIKLLNSKYSNNLSECLSFYNNKPYFVGLVANDRNCVRKYVYIPIIVNNFVCELN